MAHQDRADLAIVDAEFSAPMLPTHAFKAEEALAVNAELQKFIRGLMSNPSTWPKINGKPWPPATEIMKLWAPMGCRARIVSRNEHGEFGVRRELIETISGKRDIKFSVTMTVSSDRIGTDITISASQLLSEKVDRKNGNPLSEPSVEAQVQTRAKSAALKALSGFDPSAPPPDKRPPNEPLAATDLIPRAVALGAIPRADKAMFLDWVRAHVPGCADMQVLTVRYARAARAYIEELEE